MQLPFWVVFAQPARAARKILLGAAALSVAAPVALAEEMTNACPVDGCQVRIVSAEKDGDELKLTLQANYLPDVSKNHVHVWWGDNFTVEQVSNNAETVYHVKQGDWHPTADYPVYVTQSSASVTQRGNATTICVSPGDRNHDIIDVTKYDCRPVADLLQ
jgi:hypothetical protein